MTHRDDINNWIAGPGIKPTNPLHWAIPANLQAVRQQYLEKYRDDASRGSILRVARKILELQDGGRGTIAPTTLQALVWGWGDLVAHLKDIGVIRKCDKGDGSLYYFYALTPFARDWSMWHVNQEERVRDSGWPAADAGNYAVASQHPDAVGGAAEDITIVEPERRIPDDVVRPTRPGDGDRGSDALFIGN